jgi:hypothetical protein
LEQDGDLDEGPLDENQVDSPQIVAAPNSNVVTSATQNESNGPLSVPLNPATLVRTNVKISWDKEVQQLPLYTLILTLLGRCQDITGTKYYVTCSKAACRINKAITALKLLLPAEEWKALLPSPKRPRPGALGFQEWYMSESANEWRLEAAKLVTNAVTKLHVVLLAESTTHSELVDKYNKHVKSKKEEVIKEGYDKRKDDSPITIPVSAFGICLEKMQAGYNKMKKPLPPNLYLG